MRVNGWSVADTAGLVEVLLFRGHPAGASLENYFAKLEFPVAQVLGGSQIVKEDRARPGADRQDIRPEANRSNPCAKKWILNRKIVIDPLR